jgi:two-component system, LytTR family, sensor kinase
MPPIKTIFWNRERIYWLCQIGGWGLFLSLILFVNLSFGFASTIHENKHFLYSFIFAYATYLAVGIFVTHVFRTIVKRGNYFSFKLRRIFLLLLGGLLFLNTFMYLLNDIIIEKISKKMDLSLEDVITKKSIKEINKTLKSMNWPVDYYKKAPYNQKGTSQHDTLQTIVGRYNLKQDKNGEWQSTQSFENKILINFVQQSLSLLPWLLIYLIWHYIENNRRNELDKLKLETEVKELELKTIKNHINPHFIFNSLNSIRALVDENPQRARQAITELSNLLRSSMQAEKLNTVPLERELAIVKDYLALEHIRFEERLKIYYNIDEETLSYPIPPMMLQTLVENAIKHGISKSLEGGIVVINSQIIDSKHILTVKNTGSLGSITSVNGGFGLSSTKNRLQLLYGPSANFNISSAANEVIAQISIPQ